MEVPHHFCDVRRRTVVQTAFTFFLLSLPVTIVASNEAPAPDADPKLNLTLDPVPTVRLPAWVPADSKGAEHIRGLIRKLEEIEHPDYGLSPTMTGNAFAPVPGSAMTGMFLLTAHGHKTSAAFLHLVELGPRALPFLLEAIDDKTPTRIRLKHDTMFGGMWFARELVGNPLNKREQKVLDRFSIDKPIIPWPGNHVTGYTVKVGDVCFVITGQIVGRNYLAVRYQPSGNVVINSPTHDPKIAEAIRNVWSSPHPPQHLLDSLLLDHATRTGRDGSSFGSTNRLQVKAAMRLLYYFPDKTASLIASRLGRLKVFHAGLGHEIDYEALSRRDAANGVYTAEYVKAVAWCKEPRINAQLLQILARSTDPKILAVAVSADIDQNTVRKKLSATLDTLPPDEPGPFGDGFNLLVALGRFGGDESRPIFENYLQQPTVQRCSTLCHVFRKTHGEWATQMLKPLLRDKRPTHHYKYSVFPGKDGARLAIRICDEAAVTISMHRADLEFQMAGTHQDLDRQIADILAQLE